MSFLDEIKDEYVDEETQGDVAQATDYYKKAEKCINDGECDEVLVQAAAEYAGVDPTTAQLVYECAKKRDTNTCSKAGVTIGGIAACSYFSGGQTVLCSKAVPIVVNLIWPVVGPVVTGAVDFVRYFLSAISNVVGEAADAFGDLIGLGGDDDRATPAEIRKIWAKQFLVPTRKAIAYTMLEGVKAISVAEHSFVDMADMVKPSGAVGALQFEKSNKVFNVESIRIKAIKDIRHSHLSLLNKYVYNNNKFISDVYVIWKPTHILAQVNYRMHRSKPVVEKDEMLLHMKTAFPQHEMSMSDLQHMMKTGESSWNPVSYSTEMGEKVMSEFVPPHPGSGITFDQDGNETPVSVLKEALDPGSKKKSHTELMNEYRKAKETLKTQEYQAFVKALEWRIGGLTESISGAVGEQISISMAKKDSESSVGWWLGGIAVAAGLGYLLYKGQRR